MIYLLYTIHVVVCLFLILVVLLQQGKGADLSVFGGGATQAAFGARSAATLLHKFTVAGFVAFIVTTMGIGLLTTAGAPSSVMSDVVVEEEVPAAEAGGTAAGEPAEAPDAEGLSVEPSSAEMTATDELPAENATAEVDGSAPQPEGAAAPPGSQN